MWQEQDRAKLSCSFLQGRSQKRPSKLHVDTTKKDKQRAETFGKSGKVHTFKQQAANEQKPATTGHEVKGAAPGPRAAEGGVVKSKPRSAQPAKAGATGPR